MIAFATPASQLEELRKVFGHGPLTRYSLLTAYHSPTHLLLTTHYSLLATDVLPGLRGDGRGQLGHNLDRRVPQGDELEPRDRARAGAAYLLLAIAYYLLLSSGPEIAHQCYLLTTCYLLLTYRGHARAGIRSLRAHGHQSHGRDRLQRVPGGDPLVAGERA